MWAIQFRGARNLDDDDGSAFILLPDRPARKEPDPFYVHPDNWPAFQIFIGLQTQWRMIVGMGGVFYQGLDYPSVAALLSCEYPKQKRRLFQQIRLLEAGAVSEINGQDVSDNATHSG